MVLEHSFAVDDHRDGTVVAKRHPHVRTKDPRGNGNALLLDQTAEEFVTGLAFLGRRGFREGRPSPFPAIPVERELRDHEHGSAYITQRAVEFSLGIFENAQRGDLLGHPGHIGVRILPGDTEENAHPQTHLAHRFLADPNIRPIHTLHDGTHDITPVPLA